MKLWQGDISRGGHSIFLAMFVIDRRCSVTSSVRRKVPLSIL